ncbi:conjugal transfer relaxosome DNA-binding protein TraM [Pantoea sp. M_9]|uniref:conjugal transfer relaxosome DNA-binding protein TraM n=1 Tax=Pantoea sp. M_9 TaxID=2608041 RepID=UPI001231CBE3|nr:conjugal transfer relaxosome DNA-binding protein TraM [Pantoea sp. M_9]KAA5971657.1 relaxosome protein TraM [Pantoea sp. M_9]
MPRVQAFLSETSIKHINNIVEARLNEGASVKEANVSSITAMLIELGLRVYQYRQENKDDIFNQTDFNRTLLENAIAARIQTAKIIAALKLLPDLNRNEAFDILKVKSDTERSTQEVIKRFFNDDEGKDH